MLLIISYSFPPANAPSAQRPYFMAKYLAEAGEQVKVVTPKKAISALGNSRWSDPDPDMLIKTDSIEGFLLRIAADDYAKVGTEPGAKAPKAFKVDWKKRLVNELGRQFLIPDRAALWRFFGLRAARKFLAENPDCKFVYSTSPSFTNHLIARRLKKEFGLTWIADIRDYHFMHVAERENLWFRKPLDRRFEEQVLREADFLTFISESMRREYEGRYPFISGKSRVIYNGFDPSEFAGQVKPLASGGPLRVFYAGSFYKGVRSPRPLLLALEKLVESGKISPENVEIEIAGKIPAEIFEGLRYLKIFKSVRLLGLIPRRAALEKMMSAHLLWLIIGETPAHYTGFPVKGYEYLGARRPILLFAPEGAESQHIIQYLGCGERFSNLENPEDIEANSAKMSAYFDQFFRGELDAPLDVPMGKLEKFTRPFQARQLLEILKGT